MPFAHRESLLEGDIAPHLRRLSLPMVWGLLAMMSFSFVDTMYIARLGTTALAAFSFTIPVVMFYMGIIYGLSIGTTAVLSRMHGERDFTKVQRMATDSLVMTTIIVAIAAFVGHLLTEPIFRLMGAQGDIMPLVRHFMDIWYWGMIFTAYMFVCNACIRSAGDTRIPSAQLILVSLLNIIIDPFLIFGWGPFPEMGLAGAALTLVLSYTITGAIGLYIVLVRRNMLVLPLFHEGTFAAWKRLLHIAVPSIVSNLIGPFSIAIITWMAANLSREAVAALGVATRIESLGIIVFYAMGAGISIFTGQNFGAGNFGRIQDMLRLAYKYIFIWSGVIFATLWIFAEQIPLLFDRHPEVVRYTAQYLHIVPWSYAGLGIMVVVTSAFTAMGRPMAATFLILLRVLIIYVPLAYLAEQKAGFIGIAAALMITNILIGVISHLWNKLTAV